MSLWDGETNLFLDEDDPRGLGLSETAYHFIGGLKKHAQRVQRGHRADGQLVQAAQARRRRRAARPGRRCGSRYGYNNRTQMLRIPAPAASRTGRSTARATRISRPRCARGRARRDRERARRRRAELGEPLRDPATTSCGARARDAARRTCSSATRELERDDVLREALGRGRDEDYVDYFIRVKRDEWNRYHEQVTPWEIQEYLTRF